MFSLRSQKVLIWWTIVFAAIYGLALRFLLHMMPPPTAKWSSAQIAQFYAEHTTEIKWGATIASWTSASFTPLVIVVGIQLYRHERGRPVWVDPRHRKRCHHGDIPGAASVVLGRCRLHPKSPG
jgi:hypothetical protein